MPDEAFGTTDPMLQTRILLGLGRKNAHSDLWVTISAKSFGFRFRMRGPHTECDVVVKMWL
jgi:hypothetical protein